MPHETPTDDMVEAARFTLIGICGFEVTAQTVRKALESAVAPAPAEHVVGSDIPLLADLQRHVDEIGHTQRGQDIAAAIEVIRSLASRSSTESIDVLREATRLGEAEFLLRRSADKLHEAMKYWDKPSKPGLWRSNASVLTDQIDAFLRAAPGASEVEG